MLESFVIGAAGSLTASFAFIYFLFYYHRPELRISPQIAKRINAAGKSLYTFKISNETRSYPLIDITVELILATPRDIPKGKIHDIEILARQQRFSLDRRNEPSEPSGHETSMTFGNLENRWTQDNQHLEVRVLVRHGLTQFSRVFSQTYRTRSACIQMGQFEDGSFEIHGEG